MASPRRAVVAALLLAIAISVAALLALGDVAATPANGPEAAAIAETPAPAANAALTPPADDATERTAAPDVAAATDWLAHAHEVGLDLRVIDPLGLPLEGVRLRLAPFPGTPNDAEHATGADGRVALTWRARSPQMEIQLRDPRERTQRLVLRAGERRQLTLLGQRRQRGTISFTVGGSGGGANVRSATMDGGNLRIEGGDLGALLGGAASGQPRMRASLHPDARFGDALGVLAPDASAGEAQGQSLSFTLGDGAIELSGTSVRTAQTRAATPAPALEGFVFDADGKPAPKTAVMLMGAGPQPLQRVETDDQGRFGFKSVQPGEYALRAAGDALGLATAPIAVGENGAKTTLHLQRGAVVHGRAVDADGKPLGKHAVEWRAADGSWADGTATDENGRFTFANVPPAAATVLLFATDGRRVPLASVPNVMPGTTDLALAAPKAAGSRLRCTLPPGVAGQPILVAWHEASGYGESLQRGDGKPTTPWQSAPLPAGFYDVRLRLPGGGHRELGRHFVDGEHDVDLGVIELPRGGSVRIDLPDDALPVDVDQRLVEIYAVRKELDVRLEPAPLPRDRTIALPVGDYALAWRDRAGQARFHRFAVKAGEQTLVAPLR
jgi:protocatechuate 3,4-dioxygenase beta subunit